MKHWAYDSFFYHIYPLGLCGAPQRNDFCSPAEARLEKIYDWLDHIQALGANALYLGPVFESSTHGYDTVDYYHVDRRLGNNATLARLSEEIHRRGMRLVLDAVFNHVGRDYWAFYDLRQKGQASAYTHWFDHLRFGTASPYGDPFQYEGWSGHFNLVKLNLREQDVREHLFGAVKGWIEQYDIDGLRLDAADCMDLEFLQELAAFCKGLRPDFWLMGEIVHGDYRRWANTHMLDSVTNYECFKGLFSSHNDRNYFEIAYAFNRQYGAQGVYRDLPLYNFVDNHDVNRVASNLQERLHLLPIYCLLFTMPGVPSIYYGSEWGIEGRRTQQDDSGLRPSLGPSQYAGDEDAEKLVETIRRLAVIRRELPALRYGSYRQLALSHEQLAFLRETPEQQVVVVVNAADEQVALDLSIPHLRGVELVDLLNPGDRFPVQGGSVQLECIPPCWGKVLVVV